MDRLKIITEELAAYVCDKCCGKIKGLSQSETDEVCDTCRLNDYISAIEREAKHGQT